MRKDLTGESVPAMDQIAEHLVNAGREYLDPEQTAIFRDAIKQGVRPLPNET
jgi:hypothetical protein